MPLFQWVKPALAGLSLAVLGGAAAMANICDVAAHRAAAKTGVPADVLLTITRLETGQGKSAEPWPWTVNHAGDGTWFRSEDEARSYVFSKVKQGASNIDIGCFQINYRWHSDAFRSLDHMFDPDSNAAYAAQFLKQLYTEFGNWTDAAGAYHSRTPEYADRYKAKFRQFHAALDPQSGPDQAPAQVGWFFREAGTAPSSGSLFMADAGGGRPFIDLRRSQ